MTVWEHPTSLLVPELFSQASWHREHCGYFTKAWYLGTIFTMSFEAVCKDNWGYSLRDLWGHGSSDAVLWVRSPQTSTVTSWSGASSSFCQHMHCSASENIFPMVKKLWGEQIPSSPRKALSPPWTLEELCQFDWSSQQLSQQSREHIADRLVRLTQKKPKSQIITLILKQYWFFFFLFF